MVLKNLTPTNAAIIPALNGLRGVACLLVVFFHAALEGLFYPVPGFGEKGVLLFFTLSGFLMSYHYMPAQLHVRYWLAYLMSRFFRVYPVFAVVVALCFLAGQITHMAFFTELFSYANTMNHFVLLSGTYTFWTIPVEMKFYILFPFIACALLIFPRFMQMLAVIVLWLITLLLHMHGLRISLWPHLAFFMGGLVAASWHRHMPYSDVLARWWDYIAIACLVCIGMFSMQLQMEQRSYTAWNNAWLDSPVMALMVLSVANANKCMKYIFSSRFAQFIGNISYSLYLVHAYVFRFGHKMLHMEPITKSILLFSIALATSWVLYQLVERPFIRWGKMISCQLYPVNDKIEIANLNRRDSSCHPGERRDPALHSVP